MRMRIRAGLAVLVFGVVAGCSSGGGSGGGGFAPAGPAGATSSGSTGGGGGTTAPSPVRQKTARMVARSGEGFLEEDGGRLILHVKGTPYEMGVQYGELCGDRVESLVGTIASLAQSHNLPAFLAPAITLATNQLYRRYFPPDVLEEIRGVVDGARRKNPRSTLREEDLVFLGSMVDLAATYDLDFLACSGCAVWGDLTVGGKAFQTRNVDLFVGTGIENHCLVVMYKPTGKVPYANIGWAGMLQCASGMNAHGVAISQVWAFSGDRGLGQPWGITTKRILESAVNSDDAVRILRDERNRTYGCNFVFGDRGDGRGGMPQGRSGESTKYHWAEFIDDDPREDSALVGGQSYAYRIPLAVFRGDCALDPLIRSMQTASNGPSGDPRTASAYRNRYQRQAEMVLGFKAAGQKIGAPEMEQLSRTVAMPNDSLQCVVYANTDLRFWVANSAIRGGQNIQARDEPYWFYDYDYYLPTVDLALDRADYAPGDRANVQVAQSSLGERRDLEVSFFVEAGGAAYGVAGPATAVACSFDRGQASAQGVAVDLPAGLPRGPARLVAYLTERGTLDVVDVAVGDFTVR